eukprot:GCRY01001555.1.p1 GENE.GCRY01001555.1~~GCRY01001555.1.p1  ORF type:complete len:517 (+),score=122.14 GCRY01001555.1:140-1690(+)
MSSDIAKLSECVCDKALTVIILGASGDLARKKTFPALFSLFCHGLLPRHANVVGFARTQATNEVFQAGLLEFMEDKFTCDGGKRCVKTKQKLKLFLERVHYVSGNYHSKEDFERLDKECQKLETRSNGPAANRVFYFALPPTVYTLAAKSIFASGIKSKTGFTRYVLEKPFGRDTNSALQLINDLNSLFKEKEMFRIDHYLGKELVANLLVLRFGNRVFQPLWSNMHIAAVSINFKEPFGTEGRGGYFESSGIIRDVMQNHLIQVLSLLAMERPISLSSEHVRDEKVRVLRRVSPVSLTDTIVGQYTASPSRGKPGYREDKGVASDSRTPTYASCVLRVNSERWDGVPFIITCGKALDERLTEVRIQLKPLKYDLYDNQNRNEFAIRIQPDEAMSLRMNAKKPGLSEHTLQTMLNLSYADNFDVELPDAYETLIFDVIKGEQKMFVREDELMEAWRIFTPLLTQLEEQKIVPEFYEYGSKGPVAAKVLHERHGYTAQDDVEEWIPSNQTYSPVCRS